MALACATGFADALVIEPASASFIVGDDATPPAADDTRWRTSSLPDVRDAPVVWYRVTFSRPSLEADDPWSLYLPYLYGGGKVWLNGTIVAAVLQTSPRVRVRQERPLLFDLPAVGLRPADNVIYIRSVATHLPGAAGVPRLAIGSQVELQRQFDRRLFWVRSVPLITVTTGTVVGAFFLFIWFKRRDELLYGLFGLGALLWAVRTLTFIFDAMPTALWAAWRFAFYATSGGFIVVMALFSLALAGWFRRRLAWTLAGYWLIGPLVFVLGGAPGELWVNRYWMAGFIPIGLTMIVVTVTAALRQRTVATIVLAAGVVLAVFTGVHDYLVAWRISLITLIAPEWAGHRIFLLHHGANLLLVLMGAILTARFARTLRELEAVNRSLEERVAVREREIAASYARIATMQQEQATADERRRIMEDMHDGLGSRLFTSLLQVERGALAPAAMADVLRHCIGDMRLALDALSSQEQDFRTALGNLRFRWEAQLRSAGVASFWKIEGGEDALVFPPHASLQLLHILQEALTNVLKHAQAGSVNVRLEQRGQAVRLEVEDDGRGLDPATVSQGRGLSNIQARARRLGARFDCQSTPGRTSIAVSLCLSSA